MGELLKLVSLFRSKPFHHQTTIVKFKLTTYILCICIGISACRYESPRGQSTKPRTISSLFKPALDTVAHLRGYELLKEKIHKKRSKLASNPAMAETYFFDMLNDSIFGYWMYTGWDFNGHTDTPRKGEIACGYFVTTTLRDMGVKLQRYKLAQQPASVIVDKLCDLTSIKRYASIEKLNEYLAGRKDRAIYILGLDYHVGFVVRVDEVSYFIHSDYIDRSGVKREKLNESLAIRASKSYVIGSLML